MKKEKTTDKLMKIQSERLNNVLKDLHLSQADIIKVLEEHSIDVNSARMSNFVNGKRPIPDYILISLYLYLFINPKYIKGKSEDMYAIPETIFDYIFRFIKGITITENTNRKVKPTNNTTDSSQDNLPNEIYLHITMEKKYYDYWIEHSLHKHAGQRGNFSCEKILSDIKELYKNGKHDVEEYLLLPRNTFLEILTKDIPAEKVLQEIIDVMEYSNYPNCEETLNIKFPKNNTDN